MALNIPEVSTEPEKSNVCMTLGRVSNLRSVTLVRSTQYSSGHNMDIELKSMPPDASLDALGVEMQSFNQLLCARATHISTDSGMNMQSCLHRFAYNTNSLLGTVKA